MERKIFTFEEARKLIPAVRKRTQQAMEAIEEVGALEEDEEPTADQVPRDDASLAILLAWARDMEKLGLEVKGPWLVDFDSGGGYYCWRWPEQSLEFFHGYEEGFSGRVRLQ